MTGTILNSTFQPFLASAHFQTCYPALLRPRCTLPLLSERVELLDGDFIDLLRTPEPVASKPTVLILHGLGGSVRSHYIAPMINALHAQGFGVVFMYLRGANPEPNRLAKSYHAGLSADLKEVVRYLQQQGQHLYAALGYSLGGNLLLKYLGECQQQSPFQKAIAVSVPFDLERCTETLRHFPNNIYDRYMLNALKQTHRRKFTAKNPCPVPVKLQHIHSLYAFDEAITAPLHGYRSAHDYYQQNSCQHFLATIKTTTLIIQASDDPIVPHNSIPTVDKLSANTSLELSAHGGHVGFIARQGVGLRYWLEQRIPAFLTAPNVTHL